MNKKILIVDDEKEIVDLLEVYLSNDGYSVYKCYNGLEAMKCIEQSQIDLAILDIMLPDIDGFRLCQKIREKFYFPIIMLTAKIEDSDKIMGLTIGADDYAKKSFTAKQRHEIITGLLKSVGLESKENDYPINLSGGEQQRVAIARALAVSPEAILCDEPTGALDKKTGTQIMELLHSVVKENGIMLLLVTHDPDIADTCDTIFEMDGGRITCAKNDT